jgi:prepilin-type N-terminal cleavage/methylation domain-containing protein
MRTSLRPGFTLIELVIAAFIFAVGALALEATAAASLRRMRRSADLALAVAVARSRFERLASSRCDQLQGGVDTIGSVVSVWAVEQSGSPIARAVSQTVTYRLDGASRSDSYRSVVPCSP